MGTAEWATRLCLALVGFVHLLPFGGVLGSSPLSRLYGVELADPDLVILMRHRAVLFGLLGALLIASVFQRRLRSAGLIGGMISVGSFVLLAVSSGEYNAELRRVVAVDVAAFLLLIVAAALETARCSADDGAAR